MNIYMPDPHRGRCDNYRTIRDKTVRCLDYEGTKQVCTFPEVAPPPTAQHNMKVYTNLEQTPWVKRKQDGEVRG